MSIPRICVFFAISIISFRGILFNFSVSKIKVAVSDEPPPNPLPSGIFFIISISIFELDFPPFFPCTTTSLFFLYSFISSDIVLYAD